jgi:hypothetical protein
MTLFAEAFAYPSSDDDWDPTQAAQAFGGFPVDPDWTPLQALPQLASLYGDPLAPSQSDVAPIDFANAPATASPDPLFAQMAALQRALATSTMPGLSGSPPRAAPRSSVPDDGLDSDNEAVVAPKDAPVETQIAAIGDYPPPPPGYNPKTWGLSQWDTGRQVLTDETGRRFTLHPEDVGHWRHWDVQGPGGDDQGRWPRDSKKPRGNQKRLTDEHKLTDPNGDAPGWEPPINFYSPFLGRFPSLPGARAPMGMVPRFVIP